MKKGALALPLSLVIATGCSRFPGRPSADSETVGPEAVTAFAPLYAANCAGCHGENGRGGAAAALADPLYPAVAEDDSIRRVVRNIGDGRFQVFAINCAHLGCPVRWFPQSNLFTCPCHGGAYHADGSPERGLFEYRYTVQDDTPFIEARHTLNQHVSAGWFIRALHGWGSNFMVAIVLVHIVQVFLFGTYKYPCELTWIAGVALLPMTLGMARVSDA